MKTVQYIGRNDRVNRRPIRMSDDDAAAVVKTGQYRYVPRSLLRFFRKAALCEGQTMQQVRQEPRRKRRRRA